MGYLPGQLELEVFQYYHWTKAQFITYLAVCYLVIIIYGILIVFALCNIWVIVYVQKEYKNLPIPMFYGFSLLAVSLRPITIVWYWTESPVIFNIDLV